MVEKACRVFKSNWSGLCAPWVVSVNRGSGQWVLWGCADTWDVAIAEALRIAPQIIKGDF